MSAADWASAAPFILLAGLLALFLTLRYTDRRGWTRVFGREGQGGSPLGSALLGVDYLFAPPPKQEAIEYRLEDRGSWNQTHGADPER